MITTATEAEVQAAAERLLAPILAEFREEMDRMRVSLDIHSRETKEAVVDLRTAQVVTERIDERTKAFINKVITRLADLEKRHV